MAREAIAQLEQFGITHIHWIPFYPGAPLEEDVPHTGGSAEEELLRRERRSRLRAVIAALPVQERDLFYRKYYYCQSTAQMAAELGLTERAVEGRLYRLRQSLRRLLGGELYD